MNENESFWYHNYQVVQAQLVEYYERNQKAIKYLEDNTRYSVLSGMVEFFGSTEEIIDILKGSDKE